MRRFVLIPSKFLREVNDANVVSEAVDRRVRLFITKKNWNLRMSEFPDGSPSSTVLLDSADSLSFRDKTLMKRSASKLHNNNFKAGYVPVHEQYLQKTGLRGRKTFAFWVLVFLLCVLAVGNLILTLIILGVLRLGQGMQSLELVPGESTIKFFGDADLDHMYKRDGKIEGFKDIPVEIVGDDGPLVFNMVSKNERSLNKVVMNRTGIYFEFFSDFYIGGKDMHVLSLATPEFSMASEMKDLHTKITETNRISSPMDRSLNVEAKKLEVKGAEGTIIDGKEILWAADQHVYLKSLNGSVVLTGNEGIFLDIKKVPTATPRRSEFVTVQYKVCVCMPEGKLFKLPVPSNPNVKVYCNQVNWSSQHNPCM